MAKKICVVTGTRAEYGLLFWLIAELQKDSMCQLQLIASCMHLSAEYGLTYKAILEDGFSIDAKVEMLLSSDSAVGITKSMGLGLIGFADAFERLAPDLLILLGDRFECLAAAQAAYLAGIPIAHLHGGELTLGAYDDGIRHSITKLSTMHFVSADSYRNRVIQLGEHPSTVHNVGALAVDSFRNIALLPRDKIEAELGIKFKQINFVVTFHPETRGEDRADVKIFELLNALMPFSNASIVFTQGSIDVNSYKIVESIKKFCSIHENAHFFVNLGQKKYFSLLSCSDVVIGNSSSGIIEAPYLKVPTVDIGLRQYGRVKADSIISCDYDKSSIEQAIEQALSIAHQERVKKMDYYPYGQGAVAKKILKIIKEQEFSLGMTKSFYNLQHNHKKESMTI